MIPMRIVESEREGFDEPVVELWRDDEFIGMVFWDGDVAVAQIYPEGGGDVFDLDLGELVQILEMAERIVTPEEYLDDIGLTAAVEDDTDDEDWSGEHPATLELVNEFDPKAVHRTPDGEGFFPRAVAEDFISRCEELDLAVAEMEAFDLESNILKPRPNLTMTIQVPGVADWSTFRAAANAMAADTLAGWPHRSTLVIAFVVQQPDGESFVA